MKSTLIYWPMLAQLAIPIWILLLNAKRKAADRKAGNLNPDAPLDNKAWSVPVILTSNALANQFQLPVVFYALCLILASINAVSTLALVLCWVYVVMRWVHAYVHVTSNYVPTRMRVFIGSSLVLLVLFGLSVWELAQI